MHGDGDGLWLRVVSSERKAWLFRYQRQRRQREMGLGPFPAITLADARDKADAARRLLANGIDPLEQRREQRAAEAAASARATTFAEACNAYIASNEAAWRNPKHRYQWRATLDYACETLGSMPVGAIDTEHVLRVLQPLWTKKPETASRLRGRMELVLSYATARGWRDRNVLNAALWRGNLQLVLPSKRKVRKVEHLAALPWQEAPAFMRELRERESFGVNALMFAILTATRSGEVRGAAWDEIDLDRAVWTIPAARMKAEREHRVPLSKPAVTILEEMAKLRDGSGLVFLGLKRGVPLSDMTLSAVLRRMGRGELTVHGFRSTFRDWAAEATHHANHVVEQALAHAILSAVEAAYRRGDLFKKRTALMDDWAAHLENSSAQVVRPEFGQRRTAETDTHETVA
jgi:integrase